MHVSDFNPDLVKRSLAETISWCAHKALVGLAGNNNISHYLTCHKEATRLMELAYRESHRFWNRLLRRDYQRSKKYRLGASLLQDADPRSSFLLRAQLRSDSLKPTTPLDETRTERERESIVRWVVERRAELLHAGEAAIASSILPGLAGGRLLLYWPAENLADGAAEYSTRGLFDLNNAPPWDTWVAFSNDTLLSWIPPQLVELAQGGLDVNPENCIQWLR